MLRFLRTITIVVVIIIIVLDNASIVRSESPRFCGYSSKTSTCPGDRQVEIMSPFWIENRTSDDDGDCISYPGFQVICAANRRPIINISNYLYYVLSTDYYYKEGGRFTVVDVIIDAKECPQPRRNISIESTRFIRSYGGTVNMTFFYNCSRYQQNVVQHMPCLDNNNNNTSITGRLSFAFLEEEISGHKFDWYENCEEAVMVPVGINGYGNDPTSMNYTESLKRGFRLYWDYPVNCGNCELSGGKCWANETNQAITTTPFHCNCKDGTTRLDRVCPDSGSTKNRTGLIVGITVPVVLVSILCAFVIFYLRRKRARNNEEEENMPNTFSYAKLRNATADFSPTHKLGEGGFGAVYKGVMSDGKEIAVKKLLVSSNQGKREFVAEISTISAVKHGHLVKLYGCCIEGANRLLVYEYLKNKSLDQALFVAILPLSMLCAGILLRRLMYLVSGLLLWMCFVDVQILIQAWIQKECLLEWAWSLYENDRVMELLDPTLTSFNKEEAIRLLGIALLCTQASPMMRPSMSRVVTMLTADIQVITVTSKPSYLTDWQFNKSTFMSGNGTSKASSRHCDSSNASTGYTHGIDVLPAVVSRPLLHDVIGEGR